MDSSKLPSLSSITDKIRETIPSQYLIQTNRAFVTFFGSLFLYGFGLYLLSNLPWVFLPVGWVFLGTVLSGLNSVGYDCASGSFSKNEIVNEIIGNVVSMPLLNPYEPWKLQNRKETELERLSNLVTGPFWWFSSVFNWLKSNFYLRPIYMKGHRRRIWASLCCTYLFAIIYFSIVLYNAGFWGLCKYFLIPWLFYHFWMSTFIATSYKKRIGQLSDSFVHCNYPKVIEFLTNNMNYVMTRERVKLDVPNWYLKQCYVSINEKWGKHFTEVNFGWELISTLKRDCSCFLEACKMVNWPTAVFLFSTPVIGIYGLFTTPLQFNTLILFLITYNLFGIGITMGYHRYFSHRSFDASYPVHVALMIMGTGAFQGSVLWWSRDHRAHHRYSDTEKDPYGVDKGFFWAHIGWLLMKQDESKIGKCVMKDLESDPLLVWQDKYYFPFSIFVGFVLPTLIAGLGWGDWKGGFLIASVLRVVLINQATFCINSVAHYFGDQPFDDRRSARDSYLVSFLTFGEGYHNFHHEFPNDYRNGLWFLAFDPSKWIIYFLSLFGLTYNLKKFSPNEIKKGILIMKQKKLDKEKKTLKWGPTKDTLPAYTWKEIETLTSEGASLIVINGYVHDVSNFLKEHPGGEAFLKLKICKDATEAFDGNPYNHSNSARNLLELLRVGYIKEEEEVEKNNNKMAQVQENNNADKEKLE